MNQDISEFITEKRNKDNKRFLLGDQDKANLLHGNQVVTEDMNKLVAAEDNAVDKDKQAQNARAYK